MKRIVSILIAMAIAVTLTAAVSARQDVLDLSGKGITDEKLAEMIKNGEIPDTVTKLDLSNNEITDLSSLSELKNLEWLNLADNKITDLTPLSGLKFLGFLDLRNNNISDLTPLFGLKNLWGVELDGNNLTRKQIDELYNTLGLNPNTSVVLSAAPMLLASGVMFLSRKKRAA